MRYLGFIFFTQIGKRATERRSGETEETQSEPDRALLQDAAGIWFLVILPTDYPIFYQFTADTLPSIAMSAALETAVKASEPASQAPKGMRKNGKNWHGTKTPFRPTAGQTSYLKRLEERKARDVMKEREKEMKDEKEAERQRRIQAIRDRRAAKEEKLRYEKMAEKMHRKRVERLKRREKRNKLLNS
ncbi:rRNA-processing protein CGR1 [Paracoccidioides brasiliensis Pb18]|uniref:rRNA-processing protein CGR1 n=2 Tax=Paracoccidioides brasiliensis TaxID=121759 RepID=A0A0A0HW13_PARBD|nr:rRNA-processing protein CGR1 [Paracoccidioides brasiliensis Pb18]KGM92593.1 rRNA-processing protein CGR1 [Paracoccidioides brasiliensis Pb18]ODH25829.1 rRNA-processing protein CGR1 [Paracoccidioides brasiliensis]